MAATFDRLSNGRLLINVVTGGDPVELAGDGLFLDHGERYEATDEFLRIWRAILSGETVTYEGRHLRVEGAKTLFPPVQKPYPPLYFGGSSDAAHDLAAEQVDVYLTWGEPPAQVAEKIADIRARAAKHGRSLRFGIRLHVIVRETSEEAWRAADELIHHLDDATIARAQQTFARMDSVGQRRIAALHGGRRDQLEIYPNLWAGVGLVRGGAGTALVGDPEQVVARMREYAELGIDTFVLSGYPHLEEAYRFAELVFPSGPLGSRQQAMGLLHRRGGDLQPVGQGVARALKEVEPGHRRVAHQVVHRELQGLLHQSVNDQPMGIRIDVRNASMVTFKEQAVWSDNSLSDRLRIRSPRRIRSIRAGPAAPDGR